MNLQELKDALEVFIDDPGLPPGLRILMDELAGALDECGIASPPATPPPPPNDPAAETRAALGLAPAPAAGPKLAITPEPDGRGVRVRAKDERSAPVARSLQALLDALLGRPLESRSQQIMELAAWAEALEIENRELHQRLSQS